MLVLYDVHQWFQNKLLDCSSPVTLDPPKLQGLLAPQLSQAPTFPESAAYFKTF